ncbi:MAG: hypothetical protein M1405_01450 [Patescibacteria group bacterium]|nr:hypothetical protein [Patescibacteria group bacterium]
MQNPEGKPPYPGYAEMETYREVTMEMMTGVRTDLIERGMTTETAEVHRGWDIHCFFPRTDDPNRVIHLQLYIRVPVSPTIDIRIREMEQEKIAPARELGSIGSEEVAVTNIIQPRAPIFYSREVIGSFLELVFELP